MTMKSTEILKSVSYNIAYYRKKRGLTQQELADKVGISKSYLSKIESPNSKKQGTLEILLNIVEALDISFEALLETEKIQK
jgi:transcriptional regulator with XRE-family HTH domain